MDVVYLFSESAVNGSTMVRIPSYYCEQRLLRLFTVRGGVWDGIHHEFVFRNNVDAKELSLLLPDFPFVQLNFLQDEDGRIKSVQKQMLGFFDRPWEAEDDDTIPKQFDKPQKPQSPFSFPRPYSMPERFSDYWRDKLEAELRARKYSPQTRRAYIYYNRLICRTLQKTPEEIRPDDVTQFLAMMEKGKEYSASTMNLAISAIKFFFRNILKNDDITERHRPHQDGRLPMVLSKDEITKILNLERNPKHRLLLMLAYSSGLRVSEVVALKRDHIDISRKVIYIRLGKGRKDRSTLLSDKAANYIVEYCTFYGIESWLFPGQLSKRPLSIRSAQNIFDKALRRAKIPKNISIHSLRHTFATHLLESGTDIRYIQTLLGHANLRTTERYTHVARRSVLNIKSPLDSIP